MQILTTAWKPELVKDRLIWMKSSLGIAHFSKFILSCSSSTDRLTLHCSEALAATTTKGGWARKGAVRMFFQKHTRYVCIYGGQGGTCRRGRWGKIWELRRFPLKYCHLLEISHQKVCCNYSAYTQTLVQCTMSHLTPSGQVNLTHSSKKNTAQSWQSARIHIRRWILNLLCGCTRGKMINIVPRPVRVLSCYFLL